eukprot:4619908-Pleurochrysis_carterae.AAC.1
MEARSDQGPWSAAHEELLGSKQLRQLSLTVAEASGATVFAERLQEDSASELQQLPLLSIHQCVVHQLLMDQDVPDLLRLLVLDFDPQAFTLAKLVKHDSHA